MSACGDCIASAGGCCVNLLAQGWKVVLLPSEIERISAISGKSPSEFVDTSPLEPCQFEYYATESPAPDPLWARLFYRWTQPTAIADSCPFLTAEGCSLPYDSRPFLCQVYPLDFSITDNRVYFLQKRESDCRIEREMTSVEEVLACFQDDRERLERSFKLFRRELLSLLNTLQALGIRPMRLEDRPALVQVLKHTPEFEPAEIPVAEEVIDAYLSNPQGSGYHAYVAELDAEVVGYICYGPTPLTHGTWDIYWMAVAPAEKGRGIGSALLACAEARIKEARGRLILIETSSKPGYEKTRRFYDSQGYEVVCRLPDFYAPGDDKLILQKRLR